MCLPSRRAQAGGVLIKIRDQRTFLTRLQFKSRPIGRLNGIGPVSTRFDTSRVMSALKDSYKELKETQFFRILTVMAIMLALASFSMYLVESKTDSPKSLWDAVWWSLVTVTTVGYGDVVPKSSVGRLIGFGVMIFGVFLISMMTATIASVFVSRKIKEGKGLEDIRDRDHILICGWNEHGSNVVRTLFQQLKPKVPVVVLLNELPRDEVDVIIHRFPEINFKYVRGDFTKEEILDRANAWHARAAIVLADISGAHPLDKADERTLFACLAIKSRAPKVKACAELLHAENKEHLRRAGVDETTVRGEPNSTILAGAAAAEGLASVMKRLLDMDEPNKLWRVRVPDRFVGRTVEELTQHYHQKHNAILIAVVSETSPMRLEDILSTDHTAIDDFIKRKFQESGKDYFASEKGRISVQINPPWEYVLTKQDAVIVLSRTKPSDSSILEKSLDLVTGTGKSGG
ncbi:MAG: ion channel [Pseudomonadota bacterium]